VSEQLGHSSLAITGDTYTSVLPAVAQAAAEAVAGIVPRSPRAPADAAAHQALNIAVVLLEMLGPEEHALRPYDLVVSPHYRPRRVLSLKS
jgi:hypothetical protein